ncbi:hypothetical protein LguiA_023207 [Lonicera macranthoides]
MILKNILPFFNQQTTMNNASIRGGFLAIAFLLSSSLFIAKFSIAEDSITTTRFIKDGETIISSGGIFEMGFFSPGNSKNRYVGIWYKKIPDRTVVWVANRETPLTNTSEAVLKVLDQGILVLVNGTDNIIWSTNTSRSSASNPVARILDYGNLVVMDENDGNPQNFHWQSFDHPGDTLLPGMKQGKNFVTGRETYLSSWKSYDDPSSGDYTYHLDPNGYPQVTLLKDSAEIFRTGSWNGIGFSGTPSLRSNSIYEYTLVFNKEEVYYCYDLVNTSTLSRFVLSPDGAAQRWIWVDRVQNWFLYYTSPIDNCDTYSLCGGYGSCNIGNSPVCGCLDKFVPKYPEDWARTDWSKGCVRRTPLDCENGDGFLMYSGIKLPDTRYSWFNKSMNLKECEIVCLKNCTCTAYAGLDIRQGGRGCLLWFGDLIDIRFFSEGGQDIYVRMAASDLAPQVGSNRKKMEIIKVSLSLVVGIVLLCLSLTLFVWRKKRRNLLLKKQETMEHESSRYCTDESQKGDLELPVFGLSTIAAATNNFSEKNKIGEGGFGPVYKGKLEDGLEIAVKRLSKTSRQGLEEFKNEVICIAKLQHRNLVRLLGCCIQGDEKMLIYEYMVNKSLDLFIFDVTQSSLLDWHKRLQIINGIARGLLYLHQDSRLRIIHRDLKASNILLDLEMNPKISDFGMARSFGGNETEANTKRVVGTYGYMSPEYAVDGLFSVKSDVYSFGVLVLEIVSGRRNRGFVNKEHHHNLLGHAWKLHLEDRSTELMDKNVVESCHLSQVLRAIHVGILCVQQYPEDRPSMSAVVRMLSSENALAVPKQPGFYTERTILEAGGSSGSHTASSVNEITITLLHAR